MATLHKFPAPTEYLIRWRSTSGELCNVEQRYFSAARLVEDLLTGQIEKPEQVIEFNLSDFTLCDVTEQVAAALAQRLRDRGDRPTVEQRNFMEAHSEMGRLLDVVRLEMSKERV